MQPTENIEIKTVPEAKPKKDWTRWRLVGSRMIALITLNLALFSIKNEVHDVQENQENFFQVISDSCEKAKENYVKDEQASVICYAVNNYDFHEATDWDFLSSIGLIAGNLLIVADTVSRSKKITAGVTEIREETVQLRTDIDQLSTEIILLKNRTES